MSVNSQFISLMKAVGKYENVLKEVSEETFTQNPADGMWSYSETFSHIFQANLGCLISIEKCFLGTGILREKKSVWGVRAILFFGRFPPGKFKVPERMTSMTKKISREEAANLIVKFKRRLSDLKNKVDQANKYQKIKHPRLGYLNAKQWWRFIEIHTIHHTHQLKRIARKLKVDTR